jgi:hypothetical protein
MGENVVATTFLNSLLFLALSLRHRKEANQTLFFFQEMLLACDVIAAMKDRCCSSADADVAKIDFMHFNPGTFPR